MSGQGLSATGGILLGAAGAMIANNRSYRNRIRRAEDAADDAQSTADSALSQIADLVNSGDIARIGSDQVSDLLSGLAYPGQRTTPKPAPFASVPVPLPRPVFTEDDARNFSAWPGRVNLYDASGNLVNPDQAGDGQNFLTGIALGMPEVRALFAGLQLSGVPTADAVAQIFRLARGFTTFVNDSAGLPVGNSSVADYEAAWKRFLSVTDSSNGLWTRLDRKIEPGIVVANTATETELGRLTIPKVSTIAGDRLDFQFRAVIPNANGTDTFTFKVRLNSTSGTVLYQSATVAPGAINTAAEITGSGHVRASGIGGLVNWTGMASYKGLVNLISADEGFDGSVDNALVFTVTFSAADASDQAQMTNADLLRFRV